jgi:arsenical pump membrane protein
MPVLKGVSRGVLPLVSGFFVLVDGLTQTGVINSLASLAHELASFTGHSNIQAT